MDWFGKVVLKLKSQLITKIIFKIYVFNLFHTQRRYLKHLKIYIHKKKKIIIHLKFFGIVTIFMFLQNIFHLDLLALHLYCHLNIILFYTIIIIIIIIITFNQTRANTRLEFQAL